MSSHHRRSDFHRRVDDLIHHAAERLAYGRVPFFRLIRLLRGRSTVLSSCASSGHFRSWEAAQVVQACTRMANFCNRWYRYPEDWIAPDANPAVQFRSFVSHLFERYAVPSFMVRIWTEAEATLAGHHWLIDFYLHLAQGRSVRSFKRLPRCCHLGKSAAAQFMQAPDDLHPCQALRWAWIRSVGADPTLARLLTCHTVLGQIEKAGNDYEDTVRFLMRNQPVSRLETIAIVRFVDEQKFQDAETVWGPGAGPEPLQPDFTLRGRSLMTLRRHMANWRADLLSKNDSVPSVMCTRWQATEIQPLRYDDGERLWSIEELRTAQDLKLEGDVLHHCVATYAVNCARRKTTIWSMKIEQRGTRRRVLTIEVRPDSKKIMQASGKRNAPPTHRVAEMLHRWADQEGLTFQQSL